MVQHIGSAVVVYRGVVQGEGSMRGFHLGSIKEKDSAVTLEM